MQSPKLPFHIVWVTHNSRVSERMIRFKVPKGEPFLLTPEQEVEVTGYIAEIVQEDNLIVLAYNICVDHVHMLLVCGEDEKGNIVRKLKGKTTQLYKKNHGIKDKFSLWAQKFSDTYIRDMKHLTNDFQYIRYNRIKHGLPPNRGLRSIVKNMLTSIEEYLRTDER